MSSIYEEQLAWAKQRGLFIDSRVERKCVDGVWGLFAANDIAAGTELISYPLNKKMNTLTDERYTSSTPVAVKNIHKAVLEYVKGKDSEFYGHFLGFESMEDYKESSIQFYQEADLELLNRMNCFLSSTVLEMRELNASRAKIISEFEPDIDPELILLVCLNYASRGWDDSNFLPVIEYANHSDRLGKQRQNKNGKYFIEAKYSIKKGEQIFLSYSRKDMFHHACLYNYFDPGNTHYICFGSRFAQMASTPAEKEILKYTASKYRLEMSEKSGTIYYRNWDPEICFLETGPSLSLIEYLRANTFYTAQEWQAKNCSRLSLAKRMLEILNTLDQANRVEEFALKDIPEKLHRFYHMLVKEKHMIKMNKDWVIDNFYI